MKLCFEKSRPAGISGWLIDWFSGCGGMCHVETLFASGETIAARGETGVTLTTGKVYTPDKWRVYDLDRDALDPIVLNVARHEVGTPYDWSGFWLHVIPGLKQTDHAWTCNELAGYLAQQAYHFPGMVPWKMTPSSLEAATIKAGYPRVL